MPRAKISKHQVTQNNTQEEATQLEGIRKDVFLDRYSLKDEQGRALESSPEMMWRRTARGIAGVEKTEAKRKEWEEKFYWALSNFKFVPGGRILSGAGTDYKVTYYNCFVLPFPKDSRDGIIENLKAMIEIMARSGGVGINLSSLRPRGSRVRKVNGTSSGPVVWAELYSTATKDVIQQGGCFAPDSRIMTHQGLAPIKQIVQEKKDWYAATHQGYRKVTAKFDNGIKTLFEIKTDSGFKVQVTAEHRLLTVDNQGQFHLKKLIDFAVGERIVLLLGEWPQNIAYVSLNSDLPKPSKYSFGRKEVNLPALLEEELAFFIGVYDADGNRIADEFSPNGKGLRIAVAEDRPKDLERVIRAIKKVFNIDPTIRKGDGAVLRVEVYSRGINEFLTLNKLIKKFSFNVEVPELIFKSPKSVVEAYLAGVFLGDGSNRGGKGGYRISTVSEKFASQIQLLLINLGIASKIHTQLRDEQGWRPLYNVTVNGQRFMFKFQQLLSPYTEKIYDQAISLRDGSFNWPFNLTERFVYLSGLQRTIARANPTTSQKTNSFLSKNMLAVKTDDKADVEFLSTCVPDKIVSIAKVGDQPVFDLEVDQVHLLSGNGFYTSNSRRGALMLMLYDWHPDIEEFIDVKKDLTKINGANLSICISDAFMEAVKNDSDWPLIFPDIKESSYDETWEGDIDKWREQGKSVKVFKVVKAKELWEKICQAAWASAEPGLHFIERSNKWSNTFYFEKLVSTNPCVTGDTLISTAEGLVPMKEVVESHFEGGKRHGGNMALIIDQRTLDPQTLGTTAGRAFKFFDNGIKDVLKMTTKAGFELTGTLDHKVLTPEGWVELQKLQVGNKVMIQSGRGKFSDNYELPFPHHDQNLPRKWSKELGQVMGWLIADGWLRTGDKNCRVGFTFGKDDEVNLAYFKKIINNWYGKDIEPIKRQRNTIHLSYHGKSFVDFFLKLGIKPLKAGNKEVPESILTAPEETVIGFLQGLFTADGTVNFRRGYSSYVRLTSKSKFLLKGVQLLLLELGIVSRIFDRSRPPRVGLFTYTNVKGQTKSYTSDGVLYELEVSRESVLKFFSQVGFLNGRHQEKVSKFSTKNYYKDKYEDAVFSIVPSGEQRVYDLTEEKSLTFITNGIISLDCGEQPLSPWAVCNLGAVNLASFVRVDGNFDYDLLKETARIATRFLDNVIDSTDYFYKDIEVNQKKNIRRTGLGTMGLGDALIKMKIRYGSDESLEIIKKIYETIRNAAYNESSELAKEKGVFGKFDKEKYLQGHFIKRLPQATQDKIAQNGIRNAVLLTQAPTGTTSLLAGVSSGIEPVYDFSFIRRDRTGEHTIYHPLYEEWKVSHPGETSPSYFVSANDLTPEEHVRVQAAVQEFTDSSISKTVNAPNAHTVEEVKRLYMQAYDLGCKGVTYMRDGSRAGVLSHMEEKPKEETVNASAENGSGQVTNDNGNGEGMTEEINAARLRKRPDMLGGSTYRLHTPIGNAFISINSDSDGNPFEVFINVGKAGSDITADAEALGRLISIALRIPSAYPPKQVAQQIVNQLTGIGGSDSLGFGNGRIRSLPDAVAKALARHLGTVSTYKQSLPSSNDERKPFSEGDNKGVNQIKNESEAKTENASAKSDLVEVAPTQMSLDSNVIPNRDFCPECGAASFVFEEGCKKCYSCGYSKC